jgi:hypothetical protein
MLQEPIVLINGTQGVLWNVDSESGSIPLVRFTNLLNSNQKQIYITISGTCGNSCHPTIVYILNFVNNEYKIIFNLEVANKGYSCGGGYEYKRIDFCKNKNNSLRKIVIHSVYGVMPDYSSVAHYSINNNSIYEFNGSSYIKINENYDDLNYYVKAKKSIAKILVGYSNFDDWQVVLDGLQSNQPCVLEECNTLLTKVINFEKRKELINLKKIVLVPDGGCFMEKKDYDKTALYMSQEELNEDYYKTGDDSPPIYWGMGIYNLILYSLKDKAYKTYLDFQKKYQLKKWND